MNKNNPKSIDLKEYQKKQIFLVCRVLYKQKKACDAAYISAQELEDFAQSDLHFHKKYNAICLGKHLALKTGGKS